MRGVFDDKHVIMFKWLRRIGILIVVAISMVVATLSVAGLLYGARARQRTPAGILRYSSLYVPTSDGTRIAIDVALPKDTKPGQRLPVLIKGTPYWRASQLTFLGGAFAELGLLYGGVTDADVPLLNNREYAVITADTRGTGASFGHVECSTTER